jgi:hypothetical protein
MGKDWGVEAHKAAEDRLDLCQAWLYFHENEDGYEEQEPAQPDPSSAPFCGCETCVVREVLDAAWPIIEAAIRSGDFDEPPRRVLGVVSE